MLFCLFWGDFLRCQIPLEGHLIGLRCENYQIRVENGGGNKIVGWRKEIFIPIKSFIQSCRNEFGEITSPWL